MCVHSLQDGFLEIPPSAFSIIGVGSRLPVNDRYEIVWHIHNFSEDIEKYQQIGILNEAFGMWERWLYPFKFVGTAYPEKAVWHIRTAKGNQLPYDGKIIPTPFDFKKYPDILAVQWAPIPGFQWSQTMILNDDHMFSLQHGINKYDLFETVVHEIGHGLNIGHTDSKDPKEIMRDTYTPGAVIGPDSQNAIWSIHGEHLRESLNKAVWSHRMLLEIGKEAEKEIVKPESLKQCLFKLKR